MQVNERIIQIMSTVLNVPVDSINENSSTDSIEAWDSLKHMNLILALEESFEISIPDEDAANLTSFKLIALVVKDVLNNQQ